MLVTVCNELYPNRGRSYCGFTRIENLKPALNILKTTFWEIKRRLAVLGQKILMIPDLTTGFTDSRCVRPLGTHAYGFSSLTPDSDTALPGVHGVNEAMEISNLVFSTKIQVALAYLALQGSMA
jgi:hypothetical protein